MKSSFRFTMVVIALLALLAVAITHTRAQSLNGGTQVLQSLPALTGTNVPPNLPAASPLTFYYSIPEVTGTYPYLSGTATVTGTYYTTGTGQSYVYVKASGSGTTGWVNLTSTNPAQVVQ